MKSIQAAKGYDLPIQGAPLDTLETPAPPETVGVLPEHIPFIKPKLAVTEGDAVAVGDILFTDKHEPRLKFLSPGGGRVAGIESGSCAPSRSTVPALVQSRQRLCRGA